MYQLSVKFLNLAEKFAIGIWGVTILDFIPLFDLSFLSDVDIHLKAFVAVVGSIYFVIQIVFKTIDLNHKRRYNNNIRKIQDMEIQIKQENKDYLEYKKNQYKYNKVNVDELD